MANNNPYFTQNGVASNAPSSVDNEATSLQKINALLVSLASGGSSGYTLPIASDTTLGGVKVGDGLDIDGTGVLSAPVPSITLSGDVTGATSSNTVESLLGGQILPFILGNGYSGFYTTNNTGIYFGQGNPSGSVTVPGGTALYFNVIGSVGNLIYQTTNGSDWNFIL